MNVVVAGRRRGIKPTIKLSRIYLKGALGDTIHAPAVRRLLAGLVPARELAPQST